MNHFFYNTSKTTDPISVSNWAIEKLLSSLRDKFRV
jgi:hypothetical protein